VVPPSMVTIRDVDVHEEASVGQPRLSFLENPRFFLDLEPGTAERFAIGQNHYRSFLPFRKWAMQRRR